MAACWIALENITAKAGRFFVCPGSHRPESDRFLQLHSRSWMPPVERINDTWIWRPKDQAILKHKVIFWLETRFPNTFRAVKKVAVRYLVSK